jgi:N-acetylneuraminate synthase
MGCADQRVLGQGELANREIFSKSLIASRAIGPGEVITGEMIEVKSPGSGLQPNRRGELIGRKAHREIKSGGLFFATDLEKGPSRSRNYTFNRPWGIPVRFHDYDALRRKSNMDFLEFHLSYKDMDQDFGRFF